MVGQICKHWFPFLIQSLAFASPFLQKAKSSLSLANLYWFLYTDLVFDSLHDFKWEQDFSDCELSPVWWYQVVSRSIWCHFVNMVWWWRGLGLDGNGKTFVGRDEDEIYGVGMEKNCSDVVTMSLIAYNDQWSHCLSLIQAWFLLWSDASSRVSVHWCKNILLVPYMQACTNPQMKECTTSKYIFVLMFEGITCVFVHILGLVVWPWHCGMFNRATSKRFRNACSSWWVLKSRESKFEVRRLIIVKHSFGP